MGDIHAKRTQKKDTQPTSKTGPSAELSQAAPASAGKAPLYTAAPAVRLSTPIQRKPPKSKQPEKNILDEEDEDKINKINNLINNIIFNITTDNAFKAITWPDNWEQIQKQIKSPIPSKNMKNFSALYNETLVHDLLEVSDYKAKLTEKQKEKMSQKELEISTQHKSKHSEYATLIKLLTEMNMNEPTTENAAYFLLEAYRVYKGTLLKETSSKHGKPKKAQEKAQSVESVTTSTDTTEFAIAVAQLSKSNVVFTQIETIRDIISLDIFKQISLEIMRQMFTPDKKIAS